MEQRPGFFPADWAKLVVGVVLFLLRTLYKADTGRIQVQTTVNVKLTVYVRRQNNLKVRK